MAVSEQSTGPMAPARGAGDGEPAASPLDRILAQTSSVRRPRARARCVSPQVVVATAPSRPQISSSAMCAHVSRSAVAPHTTRMHAQLAGALSLASPPLVVSVGRRVIRFQRMWVDVQHVPLLSGAPHSSEV